MPLVFQNYIHRQDLRENSEVLYLFGDNEVRQGFGGQARECRGEVNAVGIATKKYPDMQEHSFWSDDEFERVKKILDMDLSRAITHLKNGGIVVCPKNGLGTGLSKLPEKAPKVFQYLVSQIEEMAKL